MEKTIEIPECYKARIEGNKIILKPKESEDERIRKFLAELVKAHTISPMREKCIAYLEKQGEQNLANSGKTCKDERSQPTNYTLEQAARIFLDALSDTPYNNKPVTDAQVITRELLKFLSDAHSYNPNAINEQNPAWSEEDEVNFHDVMWAIEQARTIAKDENDMGNLWYAERWLKSIKERVQPLLKYEWSEEDENKKNDAITAIDLMMTDSFKETHPNLYKAFGEAKDWLKSLKERYAWKPSDEQMQALANALGLANNCGEDSAYYLRTLHDTLKRLRYEKI